MNQYLLTTTGPLAFRYLPAGELLCTAEEIETPDVYIPTPPASAEVPPWVKNTILTTKGGPGAFFDVTEDEGDLPLLVSDGVVVQGNNGLVVPSGIVGGSPDGFWQLGNKSLADMPSIPAALRATAIMQKTTHSAAIAGMRLFGWAKSDFTAFVMVGLVGADWEYHTLVNGNLRIHSLGTATAQARFLHGLFSPSGTAHMKPQGYAYNLPAGQINAIDINAMSGGVTTVASPNQDPVADWVAAIGDGSDWFPYLRIDGYVDTDDPVSIAMAHV